MVNQPYIFENNFEDIDADDELEFNELEFDDFDLGNEINELVNEFNGLEINEDMGVDEIDDEIGMDIDYDNPFYDTGYDTDIYM